MRGREDRCHSFNDFLARRRAETVPAQVEPRFLIPTDAGYIIEQTSFAASRLPPELGDHHLPPGVPEGG